VGVPAELVACMISSNFFKYTSPVREKYVNFLNNHDWKSHFLFVILYININDILMDQKEIKKITDYIFLKSDYQKANLALVFGTRHPEAVNKVFELYHNELIPKILVSGGINRVTGENEAKEMSDNLINLGMKRDDIILENKSINSLENVLFSKQVIDEKIGFNKIKKIIAVVKHYHSRRALMTLKKHFPKTIELIPVTYEIYGFTIDNWFDNEIGKEKVLSEWNKIPEYLAKGDIEEL